MSDEASVVGPEGVETLVSPAGEDVVVRATGEQTDGRYDILEFTIEPGPGITPMHIHHEADEAMLVLDGELTVQLGDERRVLGPGSYARAPRGLPHTYRSSGDRPARVLFIYTPGNEWHYLEAAGEHGPVEDGSDIERLVPILEDHGIEIVGPPLGADDGDRSTQASPGAREAT